MTGSSAPARDVESVLYVTDSKKLSGGSRQMLNNAKAMAALGLRVHLMVAPDTPLAAACEELPAEVVFFDRFREYFAAGKALKRIVNERRIDVVHTFHNRAYKMGLTARLLGGRFRFFINRGVISRPNELFFLWTALSDGAVANSMQCAEVLRKHHVFKSRLNVVYNAYVRPSSAPTRTRTDDRVRFIYVGNHAPIKGYDVFAQAAARLCETAKDVDVEFTAVGFEEIAAARFDLDIPDHVGSRSRLTGDLPHDRVLQELCDADVLVVSSRKESLPNVLLEGFDCGLPVVCTDVGGLPEAVKHGFNGFLCPSEDADCLAEHMRLLAEDPDRRAAMGAAGRKLVETQLTLEAKGRRLLRVYQGERQYEPLALD